MSFARLDWEWKPIVSGIRKITSEKWSRYWLGKELTNVRFDLDFNSVVVINFSIFFIGKQGLRLATVLFFPKLGKLLGVNFIDESATNFFLDVIEKSIEQRFECLHIIKPKICCSFKNFAVNYLAITALHSADKVSNEQKI